MTGHHAIGDRCYINLSNNNAFVLPCFVIRGFASNLSPTTFVAKIFDFLDICHLAFSGLINPIYKR
jgi:hypothetical protein